MKKKNSPNSSAFESSADFIAKEFGGRQHLAAVVLGSGLGGFTNHLADKQVLHTVDIPGYPTPTVIGHSGEIVSAEARGKRILVFSGRAHYYETASTLNASVTAIVSHALGIKTIILTNASGILNESFYPGDLMLIKDQLNLTFRNVLQDLRLPATNIGPVYSEHLAGLAYAAAARAGVNLKGGVYVGLTGPSYETPAEVRVYRKLGGDAVGMSTVQEALYARAVGMQVMGISCLTNYSTGITSEKLSHSEVTEIGARVDAKFSLLLSTFIELL